MTKTTSTTILSNMSANLHLKLVVCVHVAVVDIVVGVAVAIVGVVAPDTTAVILPSCSVVPTLPAAHSMEVLYGHLTCRPCPPLMFGT